MINLLIEIQLLFCVKVRSFVDYFFSKVIASLQKLGFASQLCYYFSWLSLTNLFRGSGILVLYNNYLQS